MKSKKLLVLIFCFAFVFTRFETLKELMVKLNNLTRHQQSTAKITTQSAWDSVCVYWFLIYDEDTT